MPAFLCIKQFVPCLGPERAAVERLPLKSLQSDIKACHKPNDWQQNLQAAQYLATKSASDTWRITTARVTFTCRLRFH